jgi:hypothetical protein
VGFWACLPPKPPDTPVPPAPAVVAFDLVPDAGQGAVQGADVNVDGVHQTCCPGGVTTWTKPASQPTVDVTVIAAGYATVQTTLDFHVGPNPHVITLTPSRPMGTEAGFLHRCGPALCTEDGQPWTGIGADAFRLLEWQYAGRDWHPVVDELVGLRFNYLRVFVMYQSDAAGNGIGSFHPTGNMAGWLNAIGDLADALAAQRMRAEFTVFADAQRITLDQQPFFALVTDRLRGRWNVWLEAGNEGDRAREKNGWSPLDFQKPDGVLASRGTSLDDSALSSPWDLITIHTDRGYEWMRKSSCRELTPPTGVPCLEDEPMGAAPVASGSRDNVPAHFGQAGFLYAIEGAGGLFHSNAGVATTLLSDIERACAAAFTTAMRLPPTWAQLAPYQRGTRGGGPGIGDMPLEHLDADEGPTGALRTFCKGNDTDEWCVAAKPNAGWIARPRAGWRVVDQWGPQGELVHLAR